MVNQQIQINSPVGLLYLVASEAGLKGLYKSRQACPLVRESQKNKFLQRGAKQLELYFKGRLKEFSIPLDLDGSPFQKSVWNTLRKIPYGQTRSYKDIAKKVGRPKAYRAVGTANGKNPLSIIIPCHRVIAADGSLGGYSGGLKMKTKLLKLEKSAA